MVQHHKGIDCRESSPVWRKTAVEPVVFCLFRRFSTFLSICQIRSLSAFCVYCSNDVYVTYTGNRKTPYTFFFNVPTRVQ